MVHVVDTALDVQKLTTVHTIFILRTFGHSLSAKNASSNRLIPAFGWVSSQFFFVSDPVFRSENIPNRLGRSFRICQFIIRQLQNSCYLALIEVKVFQS